MRHPTARAAKAPALPTLPVIRCSFCAIRTTDRPGITMVAGPTVYICAECVDLCSAIVAEQRAGRPVDSITAATVELAEAREEIRELRLAVNGVVRAVRGVTKTIRIECMWCKVKLDDEDAARAHVATCDQHPAVIELRAKAGA